MNNKKFSLIELLVVIGIIGILASILLPALAGSRKAAIRAEAIGEMRQIEFAILGFLGDNNNLPQPFGYNNTADIITSSDSSSDLMRMLNDLEYQKANKSRSKVYIDGKFKHKWTIYLDTNWDNIIRVRGKKISSRVYLETKVDNKWLNSAKGK